MPIDALSEDLLTLNEAACYCPRRRQGKKPHVSTLHRWATRGSRGVILETLETPSGRCTSKQALRRFFDALTRLTERSPVRVRTHQPGQDEERQAAIDRKLRERFGI